MGSSGLPAANVDQEKCSGECLDADIVRRGKRVEKMREMDGDEHKFYRR